MQHSFVMALVVGAVGLLSGLPAGAADAYPNKPIRVIVPYPAGGVVDVQTRIVTQKLSAALGQPVIVDSKPGAGGSIGAEYVAQQPADGYTLLVSAPFLVTLPLIEPGLRWSARSFTPVVRFTLSTSYFVVPPDSPAKTVREFVDLAKKARPTWQYGDVGVGSTQGMANEMFRVSAGITLDPVTYKGAPPMIGDLIGGLFSMAILPSSVAVPQIKAGKLRALANIGSHRSQQLPGVPTIAEAGYPDVTSTSWYAFHAPAGTPADVIGRIETAMRAITALPDVKAALENAGGEAAFQSQAEFTDFLRADTQRLAKIVSLTTKK